MDRENQERTEREIYVYSQVKQRANQEMVRKSYTTTARRLHMQWVYILARGRRGVQELFC